MSGPGGEQPQKDQLRLFLATGQKHKVRAIRRGLKVDQAIISPSSSTLTSASESENNFPQKFSSLRRGSDFSASATGAIGAAPLLAPPVLKARNRSFTLSGGGGGYGPAATTSAAAAAAAHHLSRHLSSSCLAANLAVLSRSTSSLRKAISSTALNKSRSMNLLVHCDSGSSGRRHKSGAAASDLQTPWSNDSGNTEYSTSDEDVEEARKDEEPQDDKRRNNATRGHQKMQQLNNPTEKSNFFYFSGKKDIGKR